MDEEVKNELTLTNENFDEQVVKAGNKLVVVEFWAIWCGPCQIMTPVIEEIAKQYASNPKIRIAKLNVDEADQISEKYEIRSIPTIKFFLNGEVIDELIGAVPKNVLLTQIEELLQKVK